MDNIVRFDHELIQDWTSAGQVAQLNAPYIAFYKSHDHRLTYVAAKHQRVNPMTNPTLPLISMAMMTNPGAVVIESTPNYRVMPGDSLKYGEPAFAAALASATISSVLAKVLLAFAGVLLALALVTDRRVGLAAVTAIGLVQSFCMVPMAVVLLRVTQPAFRGRVMGLRMLMAFFSSVSLVKAVFAVL